MSQALLHSVSFVTKIVIIQWRQTFVHGLNHLGMCDKHLYQSRSWLEWLPCECHPAIDRRNSNGASSFQRTTESTPCGTRSASLRCGTPSWRCSGSWCKMRTYSGTQTSSGRQPTRSNACAPATAAWCSPMDTPRSSSYRLCWSISPLSPQSKRPRTTQPS